jgi:hypothetical protein
LFYRQHDKMATEIDKCISRKNESEIVPVLLVRTASF